MNTHHDKHREKVSIKLWDYDPENDVIVLTKLIYFQFYYVFLCQYFFFDYQCKVFY